MIYKEKVKFNEWKSKCNAEKKNPNIPISIKKERAV